MNADLELARAVFPNHDWSDIGGIIFGQGEAVFYPLGAHFADVLAWLLASSPVIFIDEDSVHTRDSDWFIDVVYASHDGTASGIKQAIYEAAKRVVMEGKE